MRRAPNAVTVVCLATLALTSSPGGAGAAASGAAPTAADGDGASPQLSLNDVVAANHPDHEEAADYAWGRAATMVSITLPPTDGEARDGFRVSGGVVTIGAAGTYRISGEMTDGQIVVESETPGLVRLILDNANVSCATCAPLVVNKTQKAVIVLAAGSVNRLSDGPPPAGTPDDPNLPSGAIFSRENLTIAGSGSLEVTGNVADGVVSRDGLIIKSGSLTVNAVNDGIRGKDYLVVKGGSTTVKAGRDGIRSDNDQDSEKGYVSLAGGTTTITAVDDGVSALTDFVMTGGTLSVTTTGRRAPTTRQQPTPPHGIRAGVNIMIGDGTVTAWSVGDGVNAGSLISVSGGSVTLTTGDDGFHSDIEVNISGGNVKVLGCYEGIEALLVKVRGGGLSITSRNDGLNADHGKTAEPAVPRKPLIWISGGTIHILANDDGIDSNGTMTVSGGETTIDVDGDDGIDCDYGMTMAGGTVVVSGMEVKGDGHIGVQGPIAVTGGTLMAGAAAVVVSRPPADAPQGWLCFWFDQRVPADKVVQIAAGDRVIVGYRSPKSIDSVFFTSDQVHAGEKYDIYVGGSVTGAPIGEMYPGGDLTNAVRVRIVPANR